MTDRWLVSDYRFHEHKSLGKAETEMARLSGQHPEKAFRIYRIKSSLTRSLSRQVINDQAGRIQKLERIIGLAAVALASVKSDHPSVVAAIQAIQAEIRRAQAKRNAASCDQSPTVRNIQ